MRIGSFCVGRPVLGIALGSGSARGWAHIGILRALEEAGIFPRVITGTSSGGVVAAFYAAGALNSVEDFVRTYSGFGDTIAHLDFGLGNAGMITGKRWLSKFLETYLPVRDFSQLRMPLGVVAADIISMREVHITSGPLIPALRGTVAVPGFFSPLAFQDMMLVDGGILNPVPVDLAYRLGADVVIAVDLDSNRIRAVPRTAPEVVHRSFETTIRRVREVNIARTRPAVIIRPSLHEIGFLDFHKGKIAIAEGHRAAMQHMDEIRRVLRPSVRRLPPFGTEAIEREILEWEKP